MTKKKNKMDRDALLYRAVVPKGHRPRTDEQLERMLNTVTPAPMDNQKLARMLHKAKGEADTFKESVDVSHAEVSLTAEEQQMAALCRSKGRPLPPELEAKIRAMEARAGGTPDQDKR